MAIETKVCRHCGQTIRATASFCNYCGREVGVAAPQEKTVESHEETLSCPRCGAAYRRGQHFCRQCGMPLEAVAAQATGAAPMPADGSARAGTTEARTSAGAGAGAHAAASGNASASQRAAQGMPSAGSRRRTRRRRVTVFLCVLLSTLLAVNCFVWPGWLAKHDLTLLEASVDIDLPTENRSRDLVESALAVTTQLYIDARLRTDQLAFVLEDGVSEEQADALYEEVAQAWDACATASAYTLSMATELEERVAQENYHGVRDAGSYAEQSTTVGGCSNPLISQAFAAEASGSSWAKGVLAQYQQTSGDNRYEQLARLLNTDAERAQRLLRSAERISAMEDVIAEREASEFSYSEKCRAIVAGAGLGITICATILCPPAGAVAWTGVALAGTSSAVTLTSAGANIALGKNNSVSYYSDKANKVLGPAAAVFGIKGLAQLTPTNIKAAFQGARDGAKAIKGAWIAFNQTKDAYNGKFVGGLITNDAKGWHLNLNLFGSPTTPEQQKELEAQLKERGIDVGVQPGADPTKTPGAEEHEPTREEVRQRIEEAGGPASPEDVRQPFEEAKEELESLPVDEGVDEALGAGSTGEDAGSATKQTGTSEQEDPKHDERELERPEEPDDSDGSGNAGTDDGKGGWMFTDVADDVSSALTASEVNGSYHVTGTFSNAVFDDLPLDDTWSIQMTSATTASVRWTGSSGVEGAPTCEVDSPASEYWSAGGGVGEISLTSGLVTGTIELRRTGGGAGDAVTFSGTLYDAAGGASVGTFVVHGTKQ